MVTLSGTIANIPPRADAGKDTSYECTGDSRAHVTLTAGGTDPESGELSFVWSREINGNWIVSLGSELATAFPLGESNVILTAIDRARAKDMDLAKITVEDTVAPEVLAVDVAPGTLWPADGKLHLFTLGDEIQPAVVDACDPAPAVRIIGVTGSGDISFGDETICIRAASGPPNSLASYSVTFEAIDAAGNASTQGYRITNTDLAPVVEDNDPRCQ